MNMDSHFYHVNVTNKLIGVFTICTFFLYNYKLMDTHGTKEGYIWIECTEY